MCLGDLNLNTKLEEVLMPFVTDEHVAIMVYE